MKALVQRVSHAEVAIGDRTAGRIDAGLLVFLGLRAGDTGTDARTLAGRLVRLRIFRDDAGRMNRSLNDTGGCILVVSQFTLYAETRGGNRPGFSAAAPTATAEPIYHLFVDALREQLGDARVAQGAFGADMMVSLCNDGPVTLQLDTDPQP